MMQCLYSAQSAAEAERELFLNMRTADEEALPTTCLLQVMSVRMTGFAELVAENARICARH